MQGVKPELRINSNIFQCQRKLLL